MKQKHNEGFSLIETVVAIAILGLIVVPSCSALLMSIRINEKTQRMMQAQLAVSSAVETLMAEGIDPAEVKEDGDYKPDPSSPLRIVVTQDGSELYYKVVVSCYESIEAAKLADKETSADEGASIDEGTSVDEAQPAEPLVKVTTHIRAKEGSGS